MNSTQLLILGNGFDLHCGLRSSYKDFFHSEILYSIVEPFGVKKLKAGVLGFWESLLLEYYKTNNKDDYAWCDIETIIKDTLWLILIGDNAKLNQGLAYEALICIESGGEINNDALRKSSTVVKFILNYCYDFFAINNLNITDGVSLLIAHLFQELKNLEKRFCKYLKNQIVNPYNENEKNEEYIIKAVNLLAALTGFAHYKFDKIDDFITVESKNYLISVFDNLDNVFILNFNYTALFDVLEVESPCYYNNVHGKLCNNKCGKDCKASDVIFGIDDNLIQTQGASSELRLFSKTYRKMFIYGDPIIILPPNDNNPIKIKFYGHSLSEADYSYFQSIFDYYDLYGNSNVSLTFYYSNGFENHDAVYKLISAYGKSLTNKEQGKNLLHKLLLENRLHIQEVRN